MRPIASIVNLIGIIIDKIKSKKYIEIIKLYNKVTSCHFSYSFHKNFKNTLAYF